MNTLGHSLCPSRCFMRGQGAGGDLRRLGEVRPVAAPRRDPLPLRLSLEAPRMRMLR